jgi:hypothetical protein
MQVKHSIITSCDYDKSYPLPNGDLIYYHTLELLNGDSGNCGVNQKFPEKLKVGTFIYYTISDNRIKLARKSDFGTK